MRVNIRPRGYKKFNRKLEGREPAYFSFPQDIWDKFYYDGPARSLHKKEALFVFLEENEVGELATDSTRSILDSCISWARSPNLKFSKVFRQEIVLTDEFMGYIAWLLCFGDTSGKFIERLKEQFPEYLPPSYA